jgi:branched-chain amino acid transport system permease protein
LSRWTTVLVLLALASIPLWGTSLYVLHILITTTIFIIAAMSLNLLLGYTGQLSLGHVAFFGIGAYASALTSLGFEVHLTDDLAIGTGPKPVWLAMLTGMLAAGLCGYALGKIAFRVRGAYFVIVSISFAEVVRLVAVNWVELTQGPMALNNVPPLALGIPGVFELSFLRKPAWFWLVLATAAVCYAVLRRLVKSQAGRAMIALRDNEALAASAGIDVTRYLVLASVVSAAMAGLAGALYVHYVRIVDPDIFLFIYTVTMVIMVVTGGKGTLTGPVAGGAVFGVLPEVLRSFAITPELQWVLFGGLMILVVFVLPRGIVPAVRLSWVRGGNALVSVVSRLLPLGAKIRFAGAANSSPPPCGEGMVAGVGRCGTAVAPPPIPPPQGGRESPAAADHILAPVGLAGDAMRKEPVLHVSDLAIRFGGLTAVENMTFDVREGEVLSLIGPNGAGKTSAFNAITGYLRPARGDISWRGRRLAGLRPHAIAALGVVRTFQKTSLFGDQSVLDNIRTGLHLRSRQHPLAIILGLPSVKADEHAREAAAWDILRFMALDARALEPGSALPYGEQRLLEVAIALAARPSLLLLDEPVSGMNPAEKIRFMATLAKIRGKGTTVLLVEHDMRTVMGVSDRVICLNQGRIIADGSPQEIQSHPEVIRAYLGERARSQGTKSQGTVRGPRHADG